MNGPTSDALARCARSLKCAAAAGRWFFHGVWAVGGVSREPGQVMRGVFEALEAGPLSVPRLALTVGASEGSTRRALRTLAQRRAVVCLGFELGSGQRLERVYPRVAPLDSGVHLGGVGRAWHGVEIDQAYFPLTGRALSGNCRTVGFVLFPGKIGLQPA